MLRDDIVRYSYWHAINWDELKGYKVEYVFVALSDIFTVKLSPIVVGNNDLKIGTYFI